MGSRIKSMFFGRSVNNHHNSGNDLRESKSYDSIVASNPPVKGSYPVAGNGPVVLDQTQLQRDRANRESFAAPAPNVARQRDESSHRPRTSPTNGLPGGSYAKSKSAKPERDRTMSGFSMKSPPTYFRRNSTKSNTDRPHPSSDATPPTIPRLTTPLLRDVKTYVPTNGITNPSTSSNSPIVFTPPFAPQHVRSSSQHSHKSHVDLLDAHSMINRTRETSVHRYKASGVRNYGEDVADRNIESFGSQDQNQRDSKLDLNSPEFSYLKSVYSPRKGAVRSEYYSRASSASSHALGPGDGRYHDDTAKAVPPRRHSRSSTRSGPQSNYPPRKDSVSAVVPPSSGWGHDDRRSTQLTGAVVDSRGRAPSKLSTSTASITEEPHGHNSSRSSKSPGTLSQPSIPERGRSRPMTVLTTTTISTTSTKQNPPPVPPPEQFPSISNGRSSLVTPIEPSSSKVKRRSMSAASHSTGVPATNGTRSRKGSITMAAFGSPNQAHTISRPAANTHERMIVEGSSQPISLEGVVDLKDSVDTEVITRRLPAVVHEHVTPTRHEIRQEVITREIHTHDVYHRVLPVIETEILPTKHYVRGKDGKTLIEIPESMVPGYKVTGKLDQNWHISKPGPHTLLNGDACETASRASTDSAADGPVIGLARGDPRNRLRADSNLSSPRSPPKREPVLSSKRESITKEGIPRTEYIWRHPPVFETAKGETQPVYIGAGLGHGGGDAYYTDEDDELSATGGPVRIPVKDEEELLFRDSGYGSVGGMLPGLTSPNPATTRKETVRRAVGQPPIVKPTSSPKSEGMATKALRKMRERRGSASPSSKSNGISGLEDGAKNMSIT